MSDLALLTNSSPMSSLVFATLVEDDDYLVNLGRGVWLMDDHRWALKVLETERKCQSFLGCMAESGWSLRYRQ